MILGNSLDLRKLPILPFAMAVIGGVLLGLHADLPTPLLLIVSAGLLLAGLITLLVRLPKWLSTMLVLLFFVSFAAYRTTLSLGRDIRRSVDKIARKDSLVSIMGRVELPRLDRDDRGYVLMKDVEIEDSVRIQCGVLRIRLYCESKKLSDLRRNDIVLVRGRLHPSSNYALTSIGSFFGILTRQEVASVRVDSTNLFAEKYNGFSLARQIDDIRAYIIRTFDTQLSPDGSALCKALILGERRDFSREFSDRLRVTGLSHIFALSGMNVGFAVAIFWVIFSLFYLPRLVRMLLLIGVVLFYMELGLEAPSLVRASLMAGCYVLGRLLHRRNLILNTVASAIFLELLWRPLDILDAGFSLSYLAVIGILAGFVYFRDGLVRLFRKPRNLFATAGIDVIATTVGAQVGTIPLVGFLFGRMPIIGALGNLLAVPGFAVLLFWSVFLLGIQPVAPFLTPPIAASINGLSFLLGKMVTFFAALPISSVFVPQFPFLILCLAYLGVAAFAIGLALRRSRWILGGLLLTGNLVAWAALSDTDDKNPSLSFIAVGNGDAILFAEGERHVLIDTGPAFDGWSASDRIIPYLRENGVTHLDAIVLTHPDNDHIGGTRGILDRIPVDRILTNGDSSDNRTFLETQLAAHEKGIEWRRISAGDCLQLGPRSTFTVLSPDSFLRKTVRSENGRSLVMRLECAGSSALLTADVDSLTEKRLLTWGSQLDCDLIKVAHHGSKSSSCGAFLDATTPTIAVISAGAFNRYGHPDPSVVRRLEERHIGIHLTVSEGSLRFSVTHGTWVYHESRPLKLARRWKLISA